MSAPVMVARQFKGRDMTGDEPREYLLNFYDDDTWTIAWRPLGSLGSWGPEAELTEAVAW